MKKYSRMKNKLFNLNRFKILSTVILLLLLSILFLFDLLLLNNFNNPFLSFIMLVFYFSLIMFTFSFNTLLLGFFVLLESFFLGNKAGIDLIFLVPSTLAVYFLKNVLHTPVWINFLLIILFLFLHFSFWKLIAKII